MGRVPGMEWPGRQRSSAMAATDRLFAGSIPEIYDRLLVPMIFTPYADDLAERLARLDPRDVLETAAGTGALTRAMARCLPAQAAITATDLNAPMLDHAAKTLGEGKRIVWQQADAIRLPFNDEQFGVMFFPDRIAGYREARRVLKAGGHFLFDVWDRIDDNEFADVVTETLAALFPQDPPRFMARTPHGYHDVTAIADELTAAGLAVHAIETVEKRSHSASARDVAVAYCQGTPLRNEIEARDA